MIRKFFTELLAEVGITLPEKKKPEVQVTPVSPPFNMSYKIAETWEVRWRSRFGNYSGDTRPEVAAFTSRRDAEQFAMALKSAFKMLRHTSGTEVDVSKGEHI